MKNFLKENKADILFLGMCGCLVVAVYHLGKVNGYLKFASDIVRHF